jgi:hypothetical protein
MRGRATGVGVFAGAATAGTLIGFGLRHGTALQPFAGAGRILLGSASARVSEVVLAFIGALLHFVLTTAWAWLALVLLGRASMGVPAAAAAAAIMAWLLTTWVLPASLAAPTADLSAIQLVLYYVVLCVTLWGGIRLALQSDHSTAEPPR